MIEAAVDLETWGIRTTSVVRSVGIVIFEDRNVLETHYFRLDQTDQLQSRFHESATPPTFLPRTMDQSTIDWWGKEENSTANATIMSAPVLTWEEGRQICGQTGDKVKRIWSKPGMFDLPMLRDLFGQDIWKYWQEACFSSLLAEFDPARTTRPQFVGTEHDALDDAKHLHTWICDFRDWMAKPAREIVQLCETACLPGNAQASEYMRGMANGLLLAKASALRESDPTLIAAP
jgi:hypothetical protein